VMGRLGPAFRFRGKGENAFCLAPCWMVV